ncbi:unannotated protein [freshwater metagenome]|uniref:Unannotated protein n=1 Tax=freshwater metagenome TaxID=449393 RepID=A0A6J6GZF5_9ZZZZ|nr:extracellular solute-binding protein [Actinomycetota bacterium]
MKFKGLKVGLLSVALVLVGTAAPAAGKTLTIWVGTGEVATYEAASAAWAKANNVNLKIVAKCGLGDCGMAQIAPTGAGPDLVSVGHDSTGGLVKSGLVESISGNVNKALFSTSVLEGVSYKYQIYGVPLSISNVALATNLALVPDGAPKTWKELESTAVSLIESKKANVGIVTHLDGYFGYPFFAAIGGYVFDTKSNAYINSKNNGLYSSKLAKNAYLMDKWLDEKLFDATNTYDASEFMNGKAPFSLVGPWAMAGLAKSGIKYDLSGIPSVSGGIAPSFSGVTALYLNRFSKNKLLARDFLVKVAQTTAFQTALSNFNVNYPALKSAAALVDPKSDAGKIGAYGQLCTPMPNIAEMGTVWSYWNGAFADWASGKTKFGPAMKEASANLKKALASS